jgi:hypothetical protein
VVAGSVMKVYVLYIVYGYEGPDPGPEVVEGIYSTREKAQEAESLVSPRHWSYIEEDVVE